MAIKTKEKIVARINGWFPDRNYGFLHENQSGQVVKHFLHAANILSGVPVAGKMVRFDTMMGPKGWIAVNVEIFDSPLDLERANAASVLADSTAPITDASAEVSK